MEFEIVWIANGYEASNVAIQRGSSMAVALLIFEENIRTRYPEIKVFNILSARLIQ